jgi:hypothetical protein
MQRKEFIFNLLYIYLFLNDLHHLIEEYGSNHHIQS